MKTIILCRHGKAEGHDTGKKDFERKLLKKGKQDFELVAGSLGKRLGKPELILTSTAKRAEQTTAILVKQGKLAKKAIDSRTELYEGTAADCIALLKSLPDELNKVALVGHNPMFEEVAHTLIKNFAETLPTSAAVAADFNIKTWQSLRSQQGKLIFLDYPKRKQDLAAPLKQFKKDLTDAVSASLQKQLGRIDTEIADQLSKTVARASQSIASGFSEALGKSRKYAKLPVVAPSGSTPQKQPAEASKAANSKRDTSPSKKKPATEPSDK